MTTPDTKAVSTALHLLYYTWGWQSAKDPEKVTRIPTAAVLHGAWSEGRLQRARLAVASGIVLPPIDVHRVKVGRRVWYVLSDGNHRTAAALEAGKRSIRARVAGEMVVPAGAFKVDASGLWASEPGRTRLVAWREEYDSDIWAAVAWLLGIAERETR